MIYNKQGDSVIITIPEGRTMLEDGVQIPAPNWTCSIPLSDTEALKEYLTDEQIINLYNN